MSPPRWAGRRCAVALPFVLACGRAEPPPAPPAASSGAPMSTVSFSAERVPAREPVTHLVVLLHGFGADGRDLLPVARALSATLPRAEFLVPNGPESIPGGGGRQWFPLTDITPANRGARVGAATPDLLAWMDRELAARGLSRAALVVGGFSQGGILTAALAGATPPPRAIFVLSGRYAPPPGLDGPLALPAFVAHGARDPVIPLAEGQEVADALAARGATVERRVYPALGHGISPEEVRDLTAFLGATIGGR